MPITPFHSGPGALIKAAVPKHFSWTIFALANVVIDLEPVSLFFLFGDPAHPWLHTLPGALGVAAIVALFGRQGCEYVLRWRNRQLAPGWQTRWLAVDPPTPRLPPGLAHWSAHCPISRWIPSCMPISKHYGHSLPETVFRG